MLNGSTNEARWKRDSGTFYTKEVTRLTNRLSGLREDFSPVIFLSNNIDRHSLELLLELKLGNRCGNVEKQWKEEFQMTMRALRHKKEQIQSNLYKELDSTVEDLKGFMPFWLVRQAATYYK
jgi:hypothetical protein